ncbi:MAG: hypothetical protein WBI21_01965 [Natronincolaceae bacterium]|nr:hypothetical protein [Bacillota bacterium]
MGTGTMALKNLFIFDCPGSILVFFITEDTTAIVFGPKHINAGMGEHN